MTSGAGTGREEEGPKRSLEVAPTRVRGSGGGRARGVVALAVVGLVIAGAVGVAQVGDDGQRRVAQAPGTTAPGSSAAVAGSPTPGPAAILDATPIRLRPTAVAVAVRDRSLDGRLVFVDGDLQVTSVWCGTLAAVRRGCVDLAIPGLGVLVRPAELSLSWAGDPPRGAWLVTVARGGSLVYLGSLVPDHLGPASLAELDRRIATSNAVAPGPGTLFEASGVLVARGPLPCSEVCPTPPPYLGDAPASPSTGRTVNGPVVEVGTSTPEVDPDAAFTAGTFLVDRKDDGTGWRVVARYVPSRAVRVLVP